MSAPHFPRLSEILPTQWQAYAQWFDNQTPPPANISQHFLPPIEKQTAFFSDCKQASGWDYADLVRLKRLHFLIKQHISGSQTLTISRHATPLGEMIAVFGCNGLCLLEFPESAGTEREFAALAKARQAAFVWRQTEASQRLQDELNRYFSGSLRHFQTPLDPVGTPFQQRVWQELLNIDYGQTCSYAEQSMRIGNPKAVRAVAAANGQNKISILIPCHRVIGSNGTLTGYAGGLSRKQALLELEQRNLPAQTQKRDI